MNKESKTQINNKIIRTAMNTLKIRTYDQTSKILETSTEKMLRDFSVESIKSTNTDKVLFVVAGPNGSGKSSVISHFIDQGVCPDYYICPDYLVEDGCRNEQAYLRAMDKAESLKISAMDQKISFTMETVLFSESKLKFLLKAKEFGYIIIVVYIITSSYKINIERVALRVSQGGHDVPTEKIIARYKRCLDLMPIVIDLADFALVYDNSTYLATPRLLQSKDNNQFDTKELEKIFNNYLGEYKCTELDSGELVGKERFWEEG